MGWTGSASKGANGEARVVSRLIVVSIAMHVALSLKVDVIGWGTWLGVPFDGFVFEGLPGSVTWSCGVSPLLSSYPLEVEANSGD